MRRLRPAACLLIALGSPAIAEAQVSGTNLMEVQNGNIPFVEPGDRLDVYDRLNLDYRRQRLLAGVTFESDRASDGAYDYAMITRRFAAWSEPELGVRVGQFYTILGRGLVHRSFELPGVVLDQPGLRSRYAPSRDVDGVLVEARGERFQAVAMSGVPNGGDLSPGLEEEGLERYRGQVSGAEFSARIARSAHLGATWARASGGVREDHLGSGFAELDPAALAGLDALSLPFYAEYAVRGTRFEDFWSFATGDEDPHALYAGLNVLAGPVALSAEWKDYAAFRLGTNDPPSLVREHSRVLLNRSTHVLDATLEQGYQLEGTWSFAPWADVTANRSRSDGSLGVRDVRFEETFVELHVAPGEASRWEASAFYDDGKDEFVFVDKRETWGASASARLAGGITLIGDFERQHARRIGASFTDSWHALTVQWAGRGGVSLVVERTGDPAEEDPADTLEPPVDPRTFTGVNLSARLTERHELALFAGERRGGRACTAGTCYEVLAFKGVEARLTSRF